MPLHSCFRGEFSKEIFMLRGIILELFCQKNFYWVSISNVDKKTFVKYIQFDRVVIKFSIKNHIWKKLEEFTNLICSNLNAIVMIRLKFDLDMFQIHKCS